MSDQTAPENIAEIVGWLRHQVDIDESWAIDRGRHWSSCPLPRGEGDCTCRGSLREFNDRQRRRVAAYRSIIDFCDPTPDMPAGEGRFVAERVLLLLAAIYSDRPGWPG